MKLYFYCPSLPGDCGTRGGRRQHWYSYSLSSDSETVFIWSTDLDSFAARLSPWLGFKSRRGANKSRGCLVEEGKGWGEGERRWMWCCCVLCTISKENGHFVHKQIPRGLNSNEMESWKFADRISQRSLTIMEPFPSCIASNPHSIASNFYRIPLLLARDKSPN